MKSNLQLRFLIVILIFTGLGTALYRHHNIGYPILPGEQTDMWTIEAKVTFTALEKPVELKLSIPDDQDSIEILNESGVSSGYGFTPPVEKGKRTRLNRSVTWSKDKAQGKQELYYRVSVHKRNLSLAKLPPAPQPPIAQRYTEGSLALAAEEVISKARQRSSSTPTFVAQLNQLLSLTDQDQNVALLLHKANDDVAKNKLLQNLLLKAGYNAHFLRFVELGESATNLVLQAGVLIRQDQGSIFTRFGEPHPLPKDNVLAWQRGGPSLVDLKGGKNAEISFSILKEQLPASFVLETAARHQDKRMLDFSISSLSIDQQNAYRMLLTIPFGALVVVIMRNIIGLKTSGTFMPILLAMSFLQTQLLPGLFLFTLVVSIGLVVRAYLSRLDLLLVPRISAVVIVVIAIMVSFGIFGNKFELGIAHSVTLFPTIILAWTVERLSILWEEDGPKEVAKQTIGSLLVAIIAYAVMGSAIIRYLVFVFPELLLVVLGIILALGQYTGYRLSEMMRFSALVNHRETNH